MASVIDDHKAELAAYLRTSGAVRCDIEELSAQKEAIKARVRSHAVTPFDPQTIASDRELMLSLKEAKERGQRLQDKRDVLETRLINAREQTERIAEPKGQVAQSVKFH